MKIGVVLPQTEIGPDADAVRGYAQAAGQLGFTHVRAYDHVLGADPAVHEGDGPYDVRTSFHEPFVLYGFLAAVTSQELVPSVIILPQRQTAHYDEAARLYQRSLHIEERLGNQAGIAISYSRLGIMEAERGGDSRIAIGWHAKALVIRPKLGVRRPRSTCVTSRPHAAS